MQGLSEYTLTHLLYAGDAHVLHRGYRNADHAPVVIKLPRSEYPTARELARLRHEYLICRDIDAAFVVKVLGLSRVSARLGLVLEDFGGRPLNELIREGTLDLDASLAIASSVAEAVASLHDHGVIHRDIKPHNILINTETGTVKITDFGIATRLSQETQKAARPEALAGTLAYMSPEQTGRMNRAIDDRTDLYSLGVTLYEMLAGALPFPTHDPMELVHSHIARTPPPLGDRVPEVVNAIVMRLLAKAPEDRYQSAHGLKVDLDECRKRLRETGQIAPFSLGARDAPSTLRLAPKLYGREQDRARLLAALDRARGGAAEIVLITGHAGVGKSALAAELNRALAHGDGDGGGYFAAGKFEQRGKSAPYTGLLAALRELVKNLLAEPAEALARWKSAILGATGNLGQLLIDLLPDLGILIGPQPKPPDLGPREAENRLGLVFQNFVRVLCAPEHPVVLFLDDLQWADPASLRLLSLLLTDPERGHLLIAGAHRDDGAGGELDLFKGSLREQGVKVREIALSPLDLTSAEQLIAEALRADIAEVRPLSRLVFEKTQGNPLFMGQFLRSLHAEGIITFDRALFAFRVDMERAAAAMATDNVVDLVTAKIKKLEPYTQRVLQLAACIGHQFDLQTLSVINETSPPETAAALWDALTQGLVMPLDVGSELAAEADALRATGSHDKFIFEQSYRFLHDRVQQAAYALIEEPQRREVHLRIGRLLLARSDEAKRDARLLEIVDHLNVGTAIIADRAERTAIARLNLHAGRRAKAGAAFQAAAVYFAAGTSLLDDQSWDDEHALAFALHAERAECEALIGRIQEAAPLFDLLLARARTRLDRARVHNLLVVAHVTRGDVAAALREGRAGLALFGVEVPEAEGWKLARDAEIDAVTVNLGGRRIADLASAPMLTDPDRRAHIDLLVSLGPAAFFSGPVATSLFTAMMVNLCLRYGRSEVSNLAYAAFGHALVLSRGRYEDARAFFQLSVAVASTCEESKLMAHADVVRLSYAHSFIHFREMLPFAARAQRAGLSSGNFVHLSFACFHDIMIRLCAGFELGAVEEELAVRLALLRRIRNALTAATLLVGRQMIAALTGRTKGPTSLTDADFDEAEHLRSVTEKGLSFAVAYHHFAKLKLSVLHGDHATAIAEAAKVRETAGSAAHFHFATDVPFYAALALTGLYLSASAEDRERYASELRENEARIAVFAEQCPQNFRHKQLLIAAEVARIEGRDAEARELYDDAIDAAREDGFTHHEALASELAGMYYLGAGKPKIARLFLEDARQGYLRWGATEKARALADRHAALLAVTVPTLLPPRIHSVTTTSTEGAEIIDNAALVRSAQAIVGEIDLGRLLDRLMRIMAAHAGADRAVLLLCREDRLVVEATLTMDPDVVQVGLGAPLEGARLAESVVAFVERTREPVVLGDAAGPSRFSGDAYLAGEPPSSLLCIAMAHQGRLAGILYLENHIAREAFPQERVELASLLASHAAVAVENALLVDELRRRSRELGESNLALRETNARLERELYEREQAEAARAALKAELVRVQTPLIPITDRIMVMPLIGSIDEERARQILETALRGVAKSRASVVILDVTGVDAVDSGVQSTLISTARALTLLGAQAVITGIHPEMARALVSLGLDLGALVTRGTLAAGIAYAMERISGPRRPPPR